MNIPQQLLDELVDIVRRVAAHELETCAGIRVDDATLQSIAGNAVQCMCAPLETFGEACILSALSGASRVLVREGGTAIGAMQCGRKRCLAGK